MTSKTTEGATTQVSRRIHATREQIYKAFLTPAALASWLPPENMRGHIHEFEPRAGGRFRMTLTYEDPAASPGGKSTADTDTFQGTFKALRPDRRIVWLVQFESDRPEFAGTMTVTWDLEGAEDGTDVTVRCDGIPPGIRPEDNEAGSHFSLKNLAAFVE